MLNKKAFLFAGLGLAGITLVLLAVYLFVPPRLEVDFGISVLSSHPSNPGTVRLLSRHPFYTRPFTDFQAETPDTNLVELIVNGNIIYLQSRSLSATGEVRVKIKAGKKEYSHTYRLMISPADRDKDGYPDVAELGNNRSFREWYCSIVESQFFYPSDIWFDIHKDCAGLVEFAFKEALKQHTPQWAKNYRFLSDFNIPDDRPYFYPDVPFLGQLVFRVTAGEFNPATVSNDFALTAHGSTLRAHSMKLIGREVSSAEKGDILFFFDPDNLDMPSHSMIFIGSKTSPDPNEGYLVYHTGPGDDSKGFIKKVKIRELTAHPDPGWRPVPQNPRFMGVFRWKILD